MNQQRNIIQDINKMLPFIADVNVIISSLLGSGHSLMVFKLNSILERYQFISPEFVIIEFNNHSSEIAKRSKFSIEEATKVMDFITKQIKLISDSKFSDKLGKAREMLIGHKKDAHYLALALKFNCDILSGDKISNNFVHKKSRHREKS